MYDKIEAAGRHAKMNSIGAEAVQIRERGEILCCLDTMDSLMGELEANIEELTKRIDPVLAPGAPMKDTGAPVGPQSSPMAQSLFARNERLAYFNRLLREVFERVQL